MSLLERMENMSITDISGLAIRELLQLQNEAALALDNAKATKGILDAAIQFKYSDKVTSLRNQLEKENGVVHIEVDGISISADQSKKVSWNQEQLAEIEQRIRDSGEDPREFIDVTYKVAEKKYNAWPEHLRSSFTPARTVKKGKQNFTLSVVKEGAA